VPLIIKQKRYLKTKKQQLNPFKNPSKILPKSGFRSFSPNNKTKTLITKQKKNSSKSIKSLFKILLKYCQKLDFEAVP
jgi:hypothetical protein